MNSIDSILVIAYVGIVASLQIKTIIKLYSSVTGVFMYRFMYAMSFIVTTHFLKLRNDKKVRRGYLAAMYIAPCVFWVAGLHYCLIANVIVALQGILYAYLGKLNYTKHTCLTA